MSRVVCPGSFDPVTNGHLDIIGRAAGLHDEVIVAVLINITKKSLFTVDERVEMLREVTKDYGNVRVERFHGLTVDFCTSNGVNMIVKGLRAVSDFEYEMQMAQMNYPIRCSAACARASPRRSSNRGAAPAYSQVGE